MMHRKMKAWTVKNPNLLSGCLEILQKDDYCIIAMVQALNDGGFLIIGNYNPHMKAPELLLEEPNQ